MYLVDYKVYFQIFDLRITPAFDPIQQSHYISLDLLSTNEKDFTIFYARGWFGLLIDLSFNLTNNEWINFMFEWALEDQYFKQVIIMFEKTLEVPKYLMHQNAKIDKC